MHSGHAKERHQRPQRYCSRNAMHVIALVRPSVCLVRRTVCDGHLLQKCSSNTHFLTKSFISHS